jgi:hypothetical protein
MLKIPMERYLILSSVVDTEKTGFAGLEFPDELPVGRKKESN